MYIEICIINSYHLFEKSTIGYLEIWVLPWEQSHLPRATTTSVVQFWASLSPTEPKAEQLPHLPPLQWAEGKGLVQPEPSYLCYCCSSAIIQRENQQICVTINNPWQAPSPLLSPLNLYQIPHKLCHSLCIHDWGLWRDCLHQFVLDAPFTQAKIKSRVTDACSCIMMTTTTSLSMETKVQEKKPQSYTKI